MRMWSIAAAGDCWLLTERHPQSTSRRTSVAAYRKVFSGYNSNYGKNKKAAIPRRQIQLDRKQTRLDRNQNRFDGKQTRLDRNQNRFARNQN